MGVSNTIKAIHASRRQVPGLEDDDTWRAFLEQVTGERSIRAMADAALQKVLTALRQRGAKGGASDRPFRPSDKPHVRKVFAIWGDMCRNGIPDNATRAGLRAFVAKMTASAERPEGIGNPEWLGPDDAAKVTEALKAWQRRATSKRRAAR
jgi:phage gp16-like protein